MSSYFGSNFSGAPLTGAWRQPAPQPSRSTPPPEALWADPAWFPFELDAQSGRLDFVRADRASLSDQPFLDRRWTQAKPAGVASLADLSARSATDTPAHFLWHTGYCGSTLIAKCLDRPGKSLALREPQVLLTLSTLKRNPGRYSPAMLGGALRLLGRRFDPAEQMLIKPTNSALNLAMDAAGLTRGRMLFVYGGCEDFILAMARRGGIGFALIRSLFLSFVLDGHKPSQWSERDVFRMPDLQLTALVWHMQMAELRRSAAALGPKRARVLDFDSFLADPHAALTAADAFLELGLGEEHIAETVNGPLLKRYSKDPSAAFDPAERAAEKERLRAHLGVDLERVQAWAREVYPEHFHKTGGGAPLLG
jgi:hypothetical protein